MKYWYLLVIWNGLSIRMYGAYTSFREMSNKAIEIRRKDGENHGLHWLCIDGNGNPQLGNFSGLDLKDRPPAEEPAKS